MAAGSKSQKPKPQIARKQCLAWLQHPGSGQAGEKEALAGWKALQVRGHHLPVRLCWGITQESSGRPGCWCKGSQSQSGPVWNLALPLGFCSLPFKLHHHQGLFLGQRGLVGNTHAGVIGSDSSNAKCQAPGLAFYHEAPGQGLSMR